MKRIFILFCFFGATAQAQINTPQASPTTKLETTIGLTSVKVEYSRPGVKGRDKAIFGGLVPYGEVWRTGANASTKVTFDDSVSIKGKMVAPGTYALYTIPGDNEWTVILNNDLTLWGAGGYDEAKDALRVKVKPGSITEPAETFTIDFSNYQNNSANLNMMWDFTKVAIPIEVSTDDKVMAQIEKIMGKPDAVTFYRAADYYYQNGKDKNMALTWINDAVAQREHYAFYHLKAKILADLKDGKEAKKAAEKSMELASAADNQEYVKMNEALIKKLKK